MSFHRMCWFTLSNSPFCLRRGLLFSLHPFLLSDLFPSIFLLLLLLLCVLRYPLPQLAVHPQGFLQTEAAAHAGHSATQRAAHSEQPVPGLRHGLQARVAEGVSAVEHPGDPVRPREGREADAALAVLAQNHGRAEARRQRVVLDPVQSQRRPLHYLQLVMRACGSRWSLEVLSFRVSFSLRK